jgi:hypothetical protein
LRLEGPAVRQANARGYSISALRRFIAGFFGGAPIEDYFNRGHSSISLIKLWRLAGLPDVSNKTQRVQRHTQLKELYHCNSFIFYYLYPGTTFA